MTKMQKIWLGIFLAMFVVPEIFLGGLLSTFFNLKTVFNPSILFDSFPFFGNLMFFIEIFGIVGLLFLNTKYAHKNKVIKYIIGTVLLLILGSLLLIAYAYYSFSRVSFP
jgi:hypothetical protein